MTSKSDLDSKTQSILEKHHAANAIYIGYSGGMDSHVLLHIVSQFRDLLTNEIIAVHINHGLNENADQWADHCQMICDSIKLKLIQISINAIAPKGESQEEWARNLRYQAIMEILGDNDLLLTAHHKDDIAETLLLQLLRGAGPAGLSTMPEKAPLGAGWHVRPLLDFSRKEISCYANDLGLDWINDESNDDERFDRNYLRHRVMPVLKQRWPGMLKTLSRAAGIQSGVNDLIEDLAAEDMLVCLNAKNSTLSAQCLSNLSDTRAINVIRYWLKIRQQRSPGAKLLEQILSDVVNSDSDSSPCISWGGIDIRRYRDMIFLTRDLPSTRYQGNRINWDARRECVLDFGKLSAEVMTGKGIAYSKVAGKDINVRYRTGHEQIKLGGHHHSLKNIFQENGIPPCFRELIPLIYIDDTLIEITGLCIDEEFLAQTGEKALLISWDRAKEVYAMKYIN